MTPPSPPLQRGGTGKVPFLRGLGVELLYLTRQRNAIYLNIQNPRLKDPLAGQYQRVGKDKQWLN